MSLKSLPFDESLYSLDSEARAFFKAQTRIDDDEDLKRHILAVQKKAYKIFPYPCIHSFGFTWYVLLLASSCMTPYFETIRLGITWLPAYERVRKLYKERLGAIFVDIGCGCEFKLYSLPWLYIHFLKSRTGLEEDCGGRMAR
jgi:hypothetical protein